MRMLPVSGGGFIHRNNIPVGDVKEDKSEREY
jgi:hypothetical protein